MKTRLGLGLCEGSWVARFKKKKDVQKLSQSQYIVGTIRQVTRRVGEDDRNKRIKKTPASGHKAGHPDVNENLTIYGG